MYQNAFQVYFELMPPTRYILLIQERFYLFVMSFFVFRFRSLLLPVLRFCYIGYQQGIGFLFSEVPVRFLYRFRAVYQLNAAENGRDAAPPYSGLHIVARVGAQL